MNNCIAYVEYGLERTIVGRSDPNPKCFSSAPQLPHRLKASAREFLDVLPNHLRLVRWSGKDASHKLTAAQTPCAFAISLDPPSDKRLKSFLNGRVDLHQSRQGILDQLFRHRVKAGRGHDEHRAKEILFRVSGHPANYLTTALTLGQIERLQESGRRVVRVLKYEGSVPALFA